MNFDNPLEWLTFFTLVIGLLTIFVKIGNTQGKQDEKNSTFDKRLNSHDVAIETVKDDLTTIKEDLSFIKGKLL